MANENDQQHHPSTSTHSASDLQTDCEKNALDSMKDREDCGGVGSGAAAVGCSGTTTGEPKEDADNKDETNSYYHHGNGGRECEEMPTAAKGNLNDLVADLCLNGHRSHAQASGYGDYQMSARSGSGIHEGVSGDASFTSNAASFTTSNSTSTHNIQPTTAPTQNSSFSFKHFLSSSSAHTAPSTTVTSLDPPLSVSSSTSTTSSNSVISTTRSLQTSTGARPKVPQSNSVSSTLTVSGATTNCGMDGLSSATKMKRSPRFSSFDSQASLAEYAGASNTADLPAGEASSGGGGVGRSSDYRLYPDERERDRFAEWNLPTNTSTMTTNSSDYDRGQYVPRSYSNYEIPRPQTSPRRRVGIGANRDSRPTRLTLNTNSNATMAAKLKLDLPINQNNSGGGGGGPSSSSGASTSRRSALSSRPSDFQPPNPLPGGAAAAAALPDFVQDHWMDSWYANDMHVNSPPSSPIAAFAEDMPGSNDQAVGGGARSRNHDNAPLPGPADMGGFNMGLPEPPSSSVGSKMLPDFLSDGPIIHSSQRLADIAAGLPSNSVGSPEESTLSTQLSRLRSDNTLLQRELDETRATLSEQTARANNLERQLLEQQRLHKSETEETLDSNKKHSTAVQNLVTKLKLQVQQLTSEVEILRRERDLMREEGAVGGCNVAANCDRSPPNSYAAAAVTSSNRAGTAGSTNSAAAATTGGSGGLGGGCMGVSSSTSVGGGVGGVAGTSGVIGLRPSRAQQLSLDLRRAASNAEQNLRQLLAGVDNLRQMAANIEKSETHIDYDASPDLFSDFIDDCDDYEEYPGGPALE
ncbi:mucin-19 isoform X2 [Musca domestica]|uniref:Mucin-19 isoform X2 n=2 Tax=Musca domestica TaxID=7370 RepID=A0A9J7IGB7_MUSDO|nr:mucin-19 isoform X2 [Musca domestica]